MACPFWIWEGPGGDPSGCWKLFTGEKRHAQLLVPWHGLHIWHTGGRLRCQQVLQVPGIGSAGTAGAAVENKVSWALSWNAAWLHCPDLPGGWDDGGGCDVVGEAASVTPCQEVPQGVFGYDRICLLTDVPDSGKVGHPPDQGTSGKLGTSWPASSPLLTGRCS